VARFGVARLNPAGAARPRPAVSGRPVSSGPPGREQPCPVWPDTAQSARAARHGGAPRGLARPS